MLDEIDYNRTLICLDLLVTSSLRIQAMRSDFCFEDACVVRLAPPRRAGLTSAIRQVSRRFSSPIFGANGFALARRLFPDMPRGRLFSFAQPVDHLRGTRADAIFVDGATLMGIEYEMALIEMAKVISAGQPRFCLALLG